MTLKRSAVIDQQQQTGEHYKVPFRGEPKPLPVKRVETRHLRYNVQLGRLALSREKVLQVSPDKAALDPDDPKVQEDIERQILEDSETSELQKHISEEGQLQPGIITRDGFVINGNRRLAVLRSLWRDSAKDTHKYMEVAVLPADATPAEMYLLEVTLQMTPETRLRYGPITTAVQIRRGMQQHGLGKKEIAHAMYLSAEEVDDRLKALYLVDEYLAFIKRPADYELVEAKVGSRQGKYQHFLEILAIRERHGEQPYWEAFQRHLFQYVRSGASFHEIRGVKGWKVTDLVSFGEELPAAAGGTAGAGGQAVGTEDGAMAALAEGLEGIGGSLNEDAARAASLIRVPHGPKKPDRKEEVDPSVDPELQASVQAFQSVNELVESRRSRRRPLELIRQALRKLAAVRISGGRGAAPKPSEEGEMGDLLGRITVRVAELQTQLASPEAARLNSPRKQSGTSRRKKRERRSR